MTDILLKELVASILGLDSERIIVNAFSVIDTEISIKFSFAGHSSLMKMYSTNQIRFPTIFAKYEETTVSQEPIPMILICPSCGERHIDKGVFATKPHHTHACQTCGFVWRPAVVDTVGVRFLPGFKDPEGA